MSRTAVSGGRWLVVGALLLTVHRSPSFAESLPAASIESLSRASRLYNLLMSKGVLVGTVLTWEGTEYDVSKNYTLCDAYEGICYKAYQAGFSDPMVLAVSEDAAGQLAVQPVDYVKFKKDRSIEAAHFYMERNKVSEDDVYRIKDSRGEFMFDAMGQLTKPGENAYESELEGRPVGGGATVPRIPAAAPPKAKPAKKAPAKAKKEKKSKKIGRSDTGLSRYSVKQLLEMGYREIYSGELDCIHRVPIDDSELFMEKIEQGGSVRYFLNPKDPALLVAMKFRREKVCNPRGTATFGKE